MRVTIKDIAKKIGISVTSVSLVLNDKPNNISIKTKKLIKDTAKELNYIPNNIAVSLATKKTKMLALILPDIENMFFSTLAKKIEDLCRENGYVLLITNTNDDFSADKELIKKIVARGVDGLFLIMSNESYLNQQEMSEVLKTIKTPYVLLDRTLDGHEFIGFENQKGGYIATEFLIEKGHKKIACIANERVYNGKLRLEGYKKALLDNGIPVKDEYIFSGNYKFESGYEVAEKIFSTDVTAVFSSNDLMSIGFIKYAYEQGKTIPTDISIVSYDNTLSNYVQVPLTSVDPNQTLLCKEAFNALMNKIENKDLSIQKNIVPTLVVRDTVKNI